MNAPNPLLNIVRGIREQENQKKRLEIAKHYLAQIANNGYGINYQKTAQAALDKIEAIK